MTVQATAAAQIALLTAAAGLSWASPALTAISRSGYGQAARKVWREYFGEETEAAA